MITPLHLLDKHYLDKYMSSSVQTIKFKNILLAKDHFRLHWSKQQAWEAKKSWTLIGEKKVFMQKKVFIRFI